MLFAAPSLLTSPRTVTLKRQQQHNHVNFLLAAAKVLLFLPPVAN
jgi:hypothetical protein